MFIGHAAVGLAAKRVAPRAPLSLLMLAPLFPDLLWPIFLLTGLESVRIAPGYTVVTPLDLHDYPYSHSLVTSIGWSLLLGGVAWAWLRDRRSTVVVALGVFSHWFLDFVTHRPDMPLYPGSTTLLGLGLWNSLAGTLVIEIAITIAGILIYLRTTSARDRIGSIGLWSFVGFLWVTYFAALFGPLPPNEHVLAYTALAMWLFVPWAGWFDRHRTVRPA
jgi:membrane-bound metal-dependent hydrolase YbcI (DUF457 family)